MAEIMLTYLEGIILFSCDLFGSHLAEQFMGRNVESKFAAAKRIMQRL